MELNGHTHPRFPWAIAIVIVVLILFGFFWMNERKVERTPDQSGVEDLQTATANLAIPDFSDAF